MIAPCIVLILVGCFLFLLHVIWRIADKFIRVFGERIKRIHERVCKVKINEEVGVKYMQAWEEKYYAKEEGREEILKELIDKKLSKRKTKEQIADELETSVEVIEQLMEKMKDFVSE